MCDIHHRLRAGALIWKAGLAVAVLAVMGRIKPSQQHVYGPGTPSGGGCMSVHKFTFSGSEPPPNVAFSFKLKLMGTFSPRREQK